LFSNGLLHSYCGRFWEALHKWDEALQLTPSDEKLHEMRAQVKSYINLETLNFLSQFLTTTSCFSDQSNPHIIFVTSIVLTVLHCHIFIAG